MSVYQITKENFQKTVLESDKRVLLDFWAPWCGPCRMVAPVVEEIAEENESILVGKINVDEELDLAARFGVSSIPTLVIMDKGKVITSSIGFQPKASILKLLESN